RRRRPLPRLPRRRAPTARTSCSMLPPPLNRPGISLAGRALGALDRASGEYFAPLPRFQERWDRLSRRTKDGVHPGLQWASPAAVAQLVDAMASKAIVLRDVWVRVPPAASNRRLPARGPFQAAMTSADGEDGRDAHRRGRLPRPERGDPGGRAECGCRGLGLGGGARGLARDGRGPLPRPADAGR